MNKDITSGVNFTYFLQAAFTHKDPKSIKIQSSCQYLFALLGSAHVEASHKMLVKLIPEESLIHFLD